MRWTYGKSEAVQILVTFGLFLILEDLQRMVFGVQSVYQDTPMTLLGVSELGGIIYLNYQFLLIALAILVLVGLKLFIGYSRIGRLLAAVVEDPEVSEAVGINTKQMFLIRLDVWRALAVDLRGTAGKALLLSEYLLDGDGSTL